MRTLIFNPWNDLALASGDAHYTPPASARQMAQDLQHLPQLWRSHDPRAVSVWGWSPLLVRLLREMGVDEALLPSAEQMAAYRAASSRQTAVRLLARWRELWPEMFLAGTLVGDSRWCTTPSEVQAALAAFGGEAMLKAPWSGSGRGVHSVHGGAGDKDEAWVARTMARQGGVEVEPYYNKVVDFAMEFWAEHGQVRYQGLSLFTTTAGGVYSGNLVASEREKQRRLAHYVSPDLLSRLRQCSEQLLSDGIVPAWYTGPLGVDMMVVQTPTFEQSTPNPSFSLHPFVELNLRMTMGWIAILLAKEQPNKDCRVFSIQQTDGHYRYELNDISE